MNSKLSKIVKKRKTQKFVSENTSKSTDASTDASTDDVSANGRKAEILGVKQGLSPDESPN